MQNTLGSLCSAAAAYSKVGGVASLDGCADYAHLSRPEFRAWHDAMPACYKEVGRFVRKSPRGHFHLQRYWEYAAVMLGLGAPPHPGATVVDVGAAGSPLPFIMDKVGWCSYGVDFLTHKDVRLRKVEGPGQRTYTSGREAWEVCDATRLSDRFTNLHAAVSVSVLEHMTEQDQATSVREMVNAVRPGGRIVITVDVVRDAGAADPKCTGCRSHVCLYTPERVRQLRRMLRRLGCTVPDGDDDWRYTRPPNPNSWIVTHRHTGKLVKPWARKWIPYLVTATKG